MRLIAVFCLLGTLADRYDLAAQPLMLAGIYTGFVCIVVSVRGIFRRVPSATLYSLTFMVYYGSSVVVALRSLIGLSHPGMDWLFQSSCAVHMVLMQVAISLRFRRVVQERKEAQQTALRVSLDKEKELANKTREWEETFNSISDMVIILDRDYRIIRANRAAAEFMKTEQEALVHQRCYTLHHGTGESPPSCPCLKTFESKRPSTEEFYEPRFGKYLEVSTSPILDDAGEVAAVVHITKDIAWRKKMETEIMRTQKLESLSILAGGIAHDFNNMLTVIMSTTTLAKIYAEDNPNAVVKLQEAEKEIMHARELTNQLLSFARGDAPIKRLSAFQELLRDTMDFSLKGSNVSGEMIIAEDLWAAEIDRIQISQVISNLVINAKQAMPQGGTVVLKAQNVELDEQSGFPVNPGRYVKISVEDTGAGISPEVMPRIFDPFFTTKPMGSGLGLSLSYSIIGNHGGYIDVKSQPGEGTIFSVFLPASSEPCVEELAIEPAELRGAGRVLIMDDEDNILRNVREMIETLGYEAETARNGQEA